MATCDRVRGTIPITPRTLMFNLEDFPETEAEAEVTQREAGQASGGTWGGEGETGPVLSLLMPLETPFNNVVPNSPQVTVPAHVLNSIVAAQNNLSNMVKDFVVKKSVNRASKGENNGEDTLITKKELRCFLQNRREVSDFM